MNGLLSIVLYLPLPPVVGKFPEDYKEKCV